ncbi:MAG TPA: hypothetical protein VJQ26_03630 [Ktedonobacteraceae bacterium]|nr:hypothetical protein [Ktedonobacteraceae bacterium]
MPNGVAQTVPESSFLPIVSRPLWRACLSNVCRSPNRVPDSRCGLLLTEHSVSRPRRWWWVWLGRACIALTRYATLGQPHGRQHLW